MTNLGTTRTILQDVLETWVGEWFTIGNLVHRTQLVTSRSDTALKRAIQRLITAEPQWLETRKIEQQTQLRAPTRSYLK